MQKFVIFVKKTLKVNMWKIKNNAKLQSIVIKEFIIKELAEEFKKQFTCLVEKDVARIYKNGEEITKNISYILQFINSGRFMEGSWLNLVNNLYEGIHKIKCKYGHDDKKYETCWIIYIKYIKYKYCNCFFEYTKF